MSTKQRENKITQHATQFQYNVETEIITIPLYGIPDTVVKAVPTKKIFQQKSRNSWNLPFLKISFFFFISELRILLFLTSSTQS